MRPDIVGGNDGGDRRLPVAAYGQPSHGRATRAWSRLPRSALVESLHIILADSAMGNHHSIGPTGSTAEAFNSPR